MAWRLFNWGSRGLWYETDVAGVYVAHIFIPKGIRIVIQGEDLAAGEVLNVLHAAAPGVVGYGDVLAVANGVQAWVSSNYKNMFPAATSVLQVVATGIDQLNAPQSTNGTVVAGQRTGNALPPDLTMCLKSSTHSSGRRRRGRQYSYSPVTTDLLTPSTFTSAYANGLKGVWNNLLVQMQALGYPLVVASYRDAALYPIAEYVYVDTDLDNQRRRLKGRGR